MEQITLMKYQSAVKKTAPEFFIVKRRVVYLKVTV